MRSTMLPCAAGSPTLHASPSRAAAAAATSSSRDSCGIVETTRDEEEGSIAAAHAARCAGYEASGSQQPHEQNSKLEETSTH
jgi:hypothetical protein